MTSLLKATLTGDAAVRSSNQGPLDQKSDALTTAPVHLAAK